VLSGLFAERFGLGNVILGASWVYGLGLLTAGFAQSWHWWYYGLIAPVAVAGGTVMTLSWGLLFKLMPDGDRGTVTGLATTTKGLGLVIGRSPPAPRSTSSARSSRRRTATPRSGPPWRYRCWRSSRSSRSSPTRSASGMGRGRYRQGERPGS